MIRPEARWAPLGAKPGFAGLLSFAGVPYTESEDDLADADVVILGAPMDELVSERPGARFAPRAIRSAGSSAGPSVDDARVDGLSELTVIDFGDAPCIPAAPERSLVAIEAFVGAVVTAGAVPIVIGGDHSIAGATITACARHHGPLGLVQLDTHTDTAAQVFGTVFSHGTVMRRLVAAGTVIGSRYVQVGLRGYWPGAADFAWQEGRNVTALTMSTIREHGLASTLDSIQRQMGDHPTFVSIDMDVVDPAFAPGVGDPQPGGLTAEEFLHMCRELGARCPVVGAEIVEVIPERIGQSDITAVLAERAVRELINGLALRRRRDCSCASG
jgi:agmatinase